LIYVWYMVSRVYSGLEDGGCSVTEIELARTPRTLLQKESDTNRREIWHRDGLFKLIFVVLALSFGIAGFNWFAIPAFFSLLSLQVIIFNPLVNYKMSKQGYKVGFFHLSDSGIDGFWKDKVGEKTYYFISLIIFATTTLVLWSHIKLV